MPIPIRKKRNLLLGALTLTGVFLTVLQYTFVNQMMAIGENTPDVLLIYTVLVGFRLGPIAGSVTGFAFGCAQDMMINFLGLNALCKTVVGFTAKFFANQHVLLADKYFFPIAVLASSLVHDALYYSIQILGTNLHWWSLFTRLAFPNALYNMLLAYLIMMLLPKRVTEFIQYHVRYEF